MGNIYTLNLSNTDVSDVHALNNVNTLILINCKKIKDFNVISNVKKIILEQYND